MRKLKEKGITLVALVVTIIILLILAGVTISQVTGNNGLFSRVKQAVEKYKKAQEDEEMSLGELEEYLANSGIDSEGGEEEADPKDVLKGKIYYTEDGTKMIGTMKDHKTEDKTLQAGEEYILEEGHYEGEIIRATEGETSTLKGPHGKPLVSSVGGLEHEKIEAEDGLGNPVTIPGQFKVVKGGLVEDGIVIEDKDGNQFVWIPVSNVDGSNNEEDLIILQNGSKVEITLGRYTFDISGKPTLVQKGSQYSDDDDKFIIDSCYKENTKIDRTGKGLGAKDLEGFVNSVKNNHGYYIARYEASFGSENTPQGSYGSGITSIMTNQKPAVKPTKQNNETVHINYSATSITVGDLWRYITQEDSAKVCRQMYSSGDSEAEYVESDLISSYAWNTAIVYIEAMGYDNYANATSAKNGNTGILKNTGDTGDEVCHIYDMSGNLTEWTTEYSINAASPCVGQGGFFFGTNLYTAFRGNNGTAANYDSAGVRPIIYIK